MKKIKKLRKGMTLLEVIVAMSIFSIGTAAVTMAFAAAVKYNSLNQRRDEELSYQQAAIQNGNTTGLQLLDGHDKDMEIKFKYPSGFTYTDKALNDILSRLNLINGNRVGLEFEVVTQEQRLLTVIYYGAELLEFLVAAQAGSKLQC